MVFDRITQSNRYELGKYIISQISETYKVGCYLSVNPDNIAVSIYYDASSSDIPLQIGDTFNMCIPNYRIDHITWSGASMTYYFTYNNYKTVNPCDRDILEKL